jgi:hypothetical protein
VSSPAAGDAADDAADAGVADADAADRSGTPAPTPPAPVKRRKFTDPTIEGEDEPRQREPRPDVPDTHAGDRLVRISDVATAVFVVVAVAGAASPDVFVYPLVAVSVVMFVAGMGAFLAAYAIAINRSRTDLIGMGGLYFLAGTAPRRVQKHLLGAMAVQFVVGFGAASVRLFTPVAFASLVPLFGRGLCGLWAARHGQFAKRPPRPQNPRRSTR